jgi:hypothetical protein
MKFNSAVFAATALVLAACGGGGSSNNPEPPVLQSGQADLTYGVSGKATFDAAEVMVGAAADDSGNVYVVGNSVVKLDRSGARVSGYGGPISPPEASPLLDGAGGMWTISNGAVVKRDANGQLATSFGNAGRVQITPFPGSTGVDDRLLRLHRTPDGHILVVGAIPGFAIHSGWIVSLALMDAGGNLVQGFGTGGRKVTTGFSSVRDFASTLDAQGNLYVVTRGPIGGVMLRKVDPNGDFIADFATIGFWFGPLDCDAFNGSAVAVLSTGEVLLSTTCAPDQNIRVLKLDSQGVPVGAFGSGGSVDPFGRIASIGAILPAADGSIYVAGTSLVNACQQLAIAKLSANGALVPSFGTAGVVLTGIPAQYGTKLLALDGTGSLYAGTVSAPPVCLVDSQQHPYVISRFAR